MNNNNYNISDLMSILSKMNKEDLEEGLKKANQILQTQNKDEILKNLKNK